MCSSNSSNLPQIPNTEHGNIWPTGYYAVFIVYKHGVGIRETVWVGVWFGKSKSVVGVACASVATRKIYSKKINLYSYFLFLAISYS